MILGEKNSGGSSWSRDDDIIFEKALAIYTDETENRWEKIAGVIPGKTVEQIIEHYEILVQDVMMIESGCVHLPDYDFSEKTYDKKKNLSECGINRKDEYKHEGKSKLKQTRRKGIAWTEDEHSQFLFGLEKYGRGDWRSISRNFVVTRTPTQVASHAQKYFARLKSKNKNNTRASIHDVKFGESSTGSTIQRPITSHSTQATQATSQPSQDHRPTYVTPTTLDTQAPTQPSVDCPMYGTPIIWNMQAALQPSVNIPIYGTPIIGHSMVGPVVLPFGSNINCLAPPHIPYGVQHHSIPYSSVSGAPFNIDRTSR